MSTKTDTIKALEATNQYKYGFTTDIDQELAPKGLNASVVKFISQKKNEPQWLLEWRLKAFNSWKEKEHNLPDWSNLSYEKIDFQDIHYYAAPKSESDKPESLEDVDPELLVPSNWKGPVDATVPPNTRTVGAVSYPVPP